MCEAAVTTTVVYTSLLSFLSVWSVFLVFTFSIDLLLVLCKGSPGLCKPHELNAWHGGLARMHSRPEGTDEQMSSTSRGLSRSPLMKGEPKLIA